MFWCFQEISMRFIGNSEAELTGLVLAVKYSGHRINADQEKVQFTSPDAEFSKSGSLCKPNGNKRF